MKILVIGSGGREHALAHTFWRQGHAVFCHPGNLGIRTIAEPLEVVAKLALREIESGEARADLGPNGVLPLSLTSLPDRVRKAAIDLTVVGPETPLEQGIADLFASQDLPLFGPNQKAFRMEGSKAWSKEFMHKYQVPTASFCVATSLSAALLAARSFFAQGKQAVVKPSGLTGGKGVVCCRTYEEAETSIRQIFEEELYGGEIVIEECLFGPEVSLQVISDGLSMIPLLAAQDHKRLYDEDLGPNTGGMGATAPLPFLDQKMLEEIQQTVVEPTLRGLQQEGICYQGILYFGLMMTKAGPKVLEYNCRFGDPEAQTILPLLETDLASLMLAAVRKDLRFSPMIRWKSKASCCVVLAAKGYPASFVMGEAIRGFAHDKTKSTGSREAQGGIETNNFFPAAEGDPVITRSKIYASSEEGQDDLYCFHANTAMKDGQLVTAGGRVLGITALGNTLEEAIACAYASINGKFSWAHYRRDVGRAALSTSVR